MADRSNASDGVWFESVFDYLEWGDQPEDEYYYSLFDYMESDSGNESAMHSAEEYMQYRSQTKRMAMYIPGYELLPKKYLILVSEDENDAFMYPAQALRNRIKRGQYGFVEGKDEVHLIDIHNFQDLNRALADHTNIYALFIFGHSFQRHLGFSTSNLRGSRYNIGFKNSVENSVPVSELRSTNMLPEGFIHLYSCDAVADNGQDIAHALANHFGVKVWASKSGVSIWWPDIRFLPFTKRRKTKMWTNPKERIYDKTVGFEWVQPESGE